MVGVIRIELMASTMSTWRSTTELHARNQFLSSEYIINYDERHNNYFYN